MRLRNPIEFTHMTFRLVPEVLDPVDVIARICKRPGVVDPEVFEVRHIQHIVGLPAVRIDDAIRHHLAFYYRYQCRR